MTPSLTAIHSHGERFPFRSLHPIAEKLPRIEEEETDGIGSSVDVGSECRPFVAGNKNLRMSAPSNSPTRISPSRRTKLSTIDEGLETEVQSIQERCSMFEAILVSIDSEIWSFRFKAEDTILSLESNLAELSRQKKELMGECRDLERKLVIQYR